VRTHAERRHASIATDAKLQSHTIAFTWQENSNFGWSDLL